MIGSPRDVVEISFVAGGEPMLWYVGTDQRIYRIDLGNYPEDKRERIIFQALLKAGNALDPNPTPPITIQERPYRPPAFPQ